MTGHVVVDVYGGIADLHSMTPGILLEIRDYDVEEDDGEGRIHYDQDGKAYHLATYGEED